MYMGQLFEKQTNIANLFLNFIKKQVSCSLSLSESLILVKKCFLQSHILSFLKTTEEYQCCEWTQE